MKSLFDCSEPCVGTKRELVEREIWERILRLIKGVSQAGRDRSGTIIHFVARREVVGVFIYSHRHGKDTRPVPSVQEQGNLESKWKVQSRLSEAERLNYHAFGSSQNSV